MNSRIHFSYGVEYGHVITYAIVQDGESLLKAVARSLARRLRCKVSLQPVGISSTAYCHRAMCAPYRACGADLKTIDVYIDRYRGCMNWGAT